MVSVGLDDIDHLTKEVGGKDKEENKAVGAGGQVASEHIASHRSSATSFLIRGRPTFCASIFHILSRSFFKTLRFG